MRSAACGSMRTSCSLACEAAPPRGSPGRASACPDTAPPAAGCAAVAPGWMDAAGQTAERMIRGGESEVDGNATRRTARAAGDLAAGSVTTHATAQRHHTTPAVAWLERAGEASILHLRLRLLLLRHLRCHHQKTENWAAGHRSWGRSMTLAGGQRCPCIPTGCHTWPSELPAQNCKLLQVLVMPDVEWAVECFQTQRQRTRSMRRPEKYVASDSRCTLLQKSAQGLLCRRSCQCSDSLCGCHRCCSAPLQGQGKARPVRRH